MDTCLRIDLDVGMPVKRHLPPLLTESNLLVPEQLSVEKGVPMAIVLEKRNAQHSVISTVLICNIWCLFHMLIVTF